MNGDPWDCPPGQCRWSGWRAFEDTRGVQFRQCDLCDRRQFRTD